MDKKIILIGASGHGKVVADIAKKNGYTDISFLDDDKQIEFCGAYPVIGKCSDAKKYKDYCFVVSIGNCSIRQKIQMQLEENELNVVSLFHPSAIIADDVEIGRGTVVMAGAVINSGACIGNGCIVNTCSSVDHDCTLNDFVHVSVGAHIAGTVTIGERTWIGAGATVNNNLEIVGDCMIGSGAVVVSNIAESGTYIGVPAKRLSLQK